MTHSKQKSSKRGQSTPQEAKTRQEASQDPDAIRPADIKKIQTDIKTAWAMVQKNRYKIFDFRKGPYKSDRWIWNGAMLLVFAWLWFIAYSSDYNLDYFKCGDGERLYVGAQQTCKNPFYESQNSWKCLPELGFGEYGTKPTRLFNNAVYVTIAILILALITNHLVHNRRSKK